MPFLVLTAEVLQMGGMQKQQSFNETQIKLQLGSTKPRSGWWQFSLHKLEHLLNFCELRASPRFISEWPIKSGLSGPKLSLLCIFLFNLVVGHVFLLLWKPHHLPILSPNSCLTTVYCGWGATDSAINRSQGLPVSPVPTAPTISPISFTLLPAWLLSSGQHKSRWSRKLVMDSPDAIWRLVSQVTLCSNNGEHEKNTRPWSGSDTGDQEAEWPNPLLCPPSDKERKKLRPVRVRAAGERQQGKGLGIH